MLADQFDVFFFDMDGVLCLDRAPIPGAAEVVNTLREHGKLIRVLTNNPRPDQATLLERFAAMGLQLESSELFNVGHVTGRWLVEQYGSGTEVFVMGSDGLRRDLIACGLRVVGLEQEH